MPQQAASPPNPPAYTSPRASRLLENANSPTKANNDNSGGNACNDNTNNNCSISNNNEGDEDDGGSDEGDNITNSYVPSTVLAEMCARESQMTAHTGISPGWGCFYPVVLPPDENHFSLRCAQTTSVQKPTCRNRGGNNNSSSSSINNDDDDMAALPDHGRPRLGGRQQPRNEPAGTDKSGSKTNAPIGGSLACGTTTENRRMTFPRNGAVGISLGHDHNNKGRSNGSIERELHKDIERRAFDVGIAAGGASLPEREQASASYFFLLTSKLGDVHTDPHRWRTSGLLIEILPVSWAISFFFVQMRTPTGGRTT